jgi:hypothetical protein
MWNTPLSKVNKHKLASLPLISTPHTFIFCIQYSLFEDAYNTSIHLFAVELMLLAALLRAANKSIDPRRAL